MVTRAFSNIESRQLRVAIWFCLSMAIFATPRHAEASESTQSSQQMHLGFVDTQRVLEESALGKLGTQQLRQEFAPRSDKIKGMVQHLDALRKSLQDNAVVMSDDQRISAQMQITELSQHLQDAEQSFNEDLDAKRNSDLASLLSKANKIVDEVARRRHLDIVFQNAVYVDPRIDLTSAVIRALDASTAATSAQ